MSLTSTKPGSPSKFTYNGRLFDSHWAKTPWTHRTGRRAASDHSLPTLVARSWGRQAIEGTLVCDPPSAAGGTCCL